jgi:hypothetical protein
MRAAWLIGVPLVAVSWLGGHELAYRLAAPGAETAHGYLQQAPFFVALLLTVALGGLVLRARGRAVRVLSGRLLAALPLLGFAVQELLEGGLHGDAVWLTAAEPVFLLGVLLQIPLALAALVVAGALTEFADALASHVAPRPRLAPLPARPGRPAADLPLTDVLASGHAGRAPPARA